MKRYESQIHCVNGLRGFDRSASWPLIAMSSACRIKEKCEDAIDGGIIST